MWDLPGPGLEPMSSALAGGFLTTAPPGKPSVCFLIIGVSHCGFDLHLLDDLWCWTFFSIYLSIQVLGPFWNQVILFAIELYEFLRYFGSYPLLDIYFLPFCRLPFHPVGGNAKCSHYGNQYGGFLKKARIELPYDPAIPVLGIYLKELVSGCWRDLSTLMFVAALFTIAKMWKQPKCPLMHEWIKKILYIYTIKYSLV